MQHTFKAKRILITGGSAGIGLALAESLARAGARTALLARDAARLAEAQARVARAGAAPVLASADIRDAAALGTALEDVVDTLGGLDGLVVNAGYCHPGRFLDLETEDLRAQIETNLLGAVNTLRLGIPHVAQGGFVAITSSPAGALPIYGFAAYNATKAALSALAGSLRLELAERGITVHLLLPPDTDTPGYAHEITLYPPETRAILSGGSLLPAEKVAEVFLAGIAAGKKTIIAGSEARLALLMQRFAPWVWDLYVRQRMRAAKRGN